jgi:iron only hydrogenase large subunit-like protein
MMRVHDKVKHRAERLKDVWAKYRQAALKDGVPMTSICPGWVALLEDKKGYNVISEHVKLVRRWGFRGRI